MLGWGEQEFVNNARLSSLIAPPIESPVGQWDSWDFRGLYSQPAIATQQSPANNLPLLYPIPWQVYPR